MVVLPIISLWLLTATLVASSDPADCTHPITIDIDLLHSYHQAVGCDNTESDTYWDHLLAQSNDVILINEYCVEYIWKETARMAENFFLKKEIEKFDAMKKIAHVMDILDKHILATFDGAQTNRCCGASDAFVSKYGKCMDEHVKGIEDFLHTEKESSNLDSMVGLRMTEIIEKYEPIARCPQCRAIFARRVFSKVQKNFKNKYLKSITLEVATAHIALENILDKISDFHEVIKSSRDVIDGIHAWKTSRWQADHDQTSPHCTIV